MKISCAVPALLSLASLTLAAPTLSWYNLDNCATGATDFNFTSADLSPTPLCLGQDNYLTLHGTLSRAIVNEASLGVVGRYLNKIVYTDHFDFAAVMTSSGYPIPFPVPEPASTPISLKLAIPFKPSFPVGV